jgi:transposase
MIPFPTGVRVWLATGHTDMRKGFASLSLQVQEILRHDPLSGQLFCFRGRSGDLLKVIWHDGQGARLFTKRLERGRFLWPSSRRRGDDLLSPARLSALRDRLASSAGNLASDLSRLMFLLAGHCGCNSIFRWKMLLNLSRPI